MQVGRTFGSYRLEARLGGGGMGEVWRASHGRLGRPAALKLIRPEMLGARDDAGRALLRRRFEREARATASLSSPHTVELYDFGVADDGTLWYAMALLKGWDLDALVRRHGPVPGGRMVALLAQACDALSEAHQAGLIHRDIKPANLHVGPKGVRSDFVQVLDFGLVKLGDLDEEGSAASTLTADGMITGSPAFLPPELAGEGEVGPHTDVYALGCVAYWLLTGTLVFPADNGLKMVLAHLGQPPEPPSTRVDGLGTAFDDVILAALRKRGADRPASASAFKAALAACAPASSWTDAEAAAWWTAHPAPRVVATSGVHVADGAADLGAETFTPEPALPAAVAAVAATAGAPAAVGQRAAVTPADSPSPAPALRAGPTSASAPAPAIHVGTTGAPASAAALHVSSAPAARPSSGAPGLRPVPALFSVARADVVAQLRDNYAQSVLDLPEFERRVELAEAAEDEGALGALVADLPSPSATPAPSATALAPAARVDRVVAILSGVERSGALQLAPRTEVVTILGGAELDLRDVSLPAGDTVIRCIAILGGVEIIVPPELEVVMNGVGLLGAFSDKRRGAPTAGGPRLVIEGAAVLGGVEVRVATAKETKRRQKRLRRPG